MKKTISLILCTALLLALTACGAGKPKPADTAKTQEAAASEAQTAAPAEAEQAAGEWTREGYFQDEKENMLSVTWMDDIDEPGWYVGCMLGEDFEEDSWGGTLPQEGKTLHGALPSSGSKDDLVVTISEEGEDGLLLEVEGGETYHFTSMGDMTASIIVTVGTEGFGMIGYEQGETVPELDPEEPYQSAQVNLAEPETYTFAAAPEAGNVFVKWTKNGEDLSTEPVITELLEESADYVAVFEEDPDWQDAAQDMLDYSAPDNWAYFETGEDREADVFLICPTVDTRSETNSFDLNDKLKGNFIYALDLERGIFEDTGRLFSPYYRQMSIGAYTLPEDEREKAKETAYADVSAAFRWYLDNENKGRGIILAGFSQGGEMCLELLKEYYGGESPEAQALRDQLVAVYSIGWMVTEEMTEEFPQIVPASDETDTGKVICFDCEDGNVSETIIIPAGMKALSINPLNWKTDSTPADKSLNHGAVFEAGGEPVAELCGAYIGERGQLIVTDVTAEDYPPALDIFPEGSFHLYDYMFFFTNLKENVAKRTAAWSEQHDSSQAP